MSDPADVITTTVEPGQIRQFADFLQSLADFWQPRVQTLDGLRSASGEWVI